MPARADEFTAPYDRAVTQIDLCDAGNSGGPPLCKDAGFVTGAHDLAATLQEALEKALAKAPAPLRPLLKRDQIWFGEMIDLSVRTNWRELTEGDREATLALLRRRVSDLTEIANGFGRGGLSGRWIDAFGSVTLTPAENGAYRVVIATDGIYGPDEERRFSCRASALLKPDGRGWLAGTFLPEPGTEGGERAAEPVSLKLRRQGATLRLVLTSDSWRDETRPSCRSDFQITASYFAAGTIDATPGETADTSFVAPSFDCARPNTASEEEICADPDLADNDVRLNRAWKALLPRLDATTRQLLADDQRQWLRAQANQYPIFLHPAWEKRTSETHYTGYARDKMNSLQRERVALLEGFDDSRQGLTGAWLSASAILKVTSMPDGRLKARGWKWTQGEWKAGCDFDMTGRIVNGTFISDELRKNPDTLERDHASLIVNRQDDVFSQKRSGADSGDEPKCKRNVTYSSTARLFPAKPSPDITEFNGEHIR